jgi:catechol 2,3-dioxygenase-like lactoylglutathione lyase family enzyme
MSGLPTRFECIDPILRVEDMSAAVRYYVDVLGFEAAAWGDGNFTRVGRDGRGIYLCRGGQGHRGAWVWIGVEDVRPLFETYKRRGAIIRSEPVKESWALEMRIEDPDGNVLRFGSDPGEEAASTEGRLR